MERARGLVAAVLLASSACTVGPVGELEDPAAVTTEPTASSVASTGATAGPATAAPATAASSVPMVAVDVDRCPSDWRDDDGFDEDEIVIASHGGFGASGHASGLGDYVDAVNGEGGVLGRRLRLASIDLAPGDAVQFLQGLVWALDQEPLAVSAVGGVAVAPEMAEQVDDACIPNLYWQSLRPVPDLTSREWTVLGFDSPAVEAALWMIWVVDRFGADATVGVIEMGNGWGRDVVAAVDAARTAVAPDVAVEVVTHDPGAVDLVDALAELAGREPEVDVLVGATAGNPCHRLLVDRAAVPSLADVAVLLPAACRSPHAILIPAGIDGANTFAVDVVGRAETESSFEDRSYWHGWVAGYMIVAAIEAADELEGGLGRTNLLRAAMGIERAHPLIDGAVLGAGPARVGRIEEWSVDRGEWIDSGAALIEVPEEIGASEVEPACGWPDRLAIATSGWTTSGDRLAADARPQVTVEGLGLAIDPADGIASGMVAVTSSDGVEQFGRLVAVDQPCSHRLVLEPLPWFIADMATRPGPYEIRVDAWLISDQISASGELTVTGGDPVLEIGSFLPPEAERDGG